MPVSGFILIFFILHFNVYLYTLFFSCSRLTGCRAVALKFGRCGLHLVQAYERGELEIKPKSRKARKSVVPSRKKHDSDDEVDIRRPPSSLTSVEQELLKRSSRSPKKKKEKSKPTTFEDITADKACITRKCRNAAAPSKSGLCIACYNLLLEVNTRDPNADDFLADTRSSRTRHSHQLEPVSTRSERTREHSSSRLDRKPRHSTARRAPDRDLTSSRHERRQEHSSTRDHLMSEHSRSRHESKLRSSSQHHSRTKESPLIFNPDSYSHRNVSSSHRVDTCTCRCSSSRKQRGTGYNAVVCDSVESNASSQLSTDLESHVYSIEDFDDVTPPNWDLL